MCANDSFRKSSLRKLGREQERQDREVEEANEDSEEGLLGACGLPVKGVSHQARSPHWSWLQGQEAPSSTARALVKQPRPWGN